MSWPSYPSYPSCLSRLAAVAVPGRGRHVLAVAAACLAAIARVSVVYGRVAAVRLRHAERLALFCGFDVV